MCTNISTFAKLNFILWKNMAIISWKGVFLPNKSKKKKNNGFKQSKFLYCRFSVFNMLKGIIYERKNMWYSVTVSQALYSLFPTRPHTKNTYTKMILLQSSFFPFLFACPNLSHLKNILFKKMCNICIEFLEKAARKIYTKQRFSLHRVVVLLVLCFLSFPFYQSYTCIWF